MMPYLAIASDLDMPSPTTAFAAAAFWLYVCLACFPSIGSSAPLPNAFHICCHFRAFVSLCGQRPDLALGCRRRRF